MKTDPQAKNLQTRRPAANGLLQRQVLGILHVELRRNLLSRRALGLYALAFGPIAMLLFWPLLHLLKGDTPGGSIVEGSGVVSQVFDFYIRGPLFLATLFVFMSLFRSDILEQSLHYYLLTQVRREVLVAGKYLAALIAAGATFFVATLLIFFIMTLPWGLGELMRHLFQGPGFGHLIGYTAIMLLGVFAYGAIFLLVGLLFRNPVIPGVLIWLWEMGMSYVPLDTFLKKMSVFYYLQGLYPIPPSLSKAIGSVDNTPPVYLAVSGLLILITVILLLCAWRAREMELAYTGE